MNITIYYVEKDIENVIFLLVNNVYNTKMKALFVCDDEYIDSIDNLIWTYRKKSFIPHETIKSDRDKIINSPLIIGNSVSDCKDYKILMIFNYANILNDINLIPSNLSRLIFICNVKNNKDLENARTLYGRLYRDNESKVYSQLPDSTWTELQSVIY